MTDEEHGLVSALNHFKRTKALIEQNLKRAENELNEREKRAKERGIKEPIVIPEGYIDRDKELKEQIEISKEQLKEYEKIIEDIHKASFFER